MVNPQPARSTTAQSDVGPLVRLLLKHPREAFRDEASIDGQWRQLFWTARPDLARAAEEYDRFVALLRDAGAEVDFLPADETAGLDSLYVRDASIPTDRGLILCRMGKVARGTEPALQGEFLRGLGLPVLGEITGDGRLEGGDVTWLDETTLAVGEGYRTNAEGIRQLRALLGDGVEVLVMPEPHYKGPEDVFHIMSVLSPIDHDLALVFSPLVPVPFRQQLLGRGFRLVEVPEEEFETLGCNCLAVAPRLCLLPAGNPLTRSRLEAAGATVLEFQAGEICAKGLGGPTCLTRPLLRGR